MAQEQTPEHVVVIGSGMVGLATAWFLQAEGVRVTVVDREGVAAGSSWGNAGWLAPALTLPLPDPAILGTGVKATLSPSSPVYVPFTTNPQLLRFLAEFARNCTPKRWRAAVAVFLEANHGALAAFDTLAAGGVDEPTREADPFLAAFLSEHDRDGLVHEFEHVAEVGGHTEHELIDGDAMRALEPALSEAVTHGVLLRGQRFINPGRFVHALADAVRERGGTLLEGVEVDAVDRVHDRVEVRPVTGDTIDADAVVIASGTWLGRLARPHGVRTIVQAGRGYSFFVQTGTKPANPVYFPAQRVACTPIDGPDGAGGLRVAGMMEFRRPKAPPDPRRIRAIIDAASPLLRGIDWDARTGEWVGSRPCTADGLPLVGRTKTPGVHVAGGHGMWGIALGPLTGQLLAAQVARGETSSLLESFDPRR
jgi:D-amino-acid dehydrogenase